MRYDNKQNRWNLKANAWLNTHAMDSYFMVSLIDETQCACPIVPVCGRWQTTDIVDIGDTLKSLSLMQLIPI